MHFDSQIGITLLPQYPLNMNIRLLPSYTTERYYILSEIEDRADIELVEAKEGICITVVEAVHCRHHTAAFEKLFKTKPSIQLIRKVEHEIQRVITVAELQIPATLFICSGIYEIAPVNLMIAS